MNPIISYLLEVSATLLICFAAVLYFRPYLRRILTDLCGTQERGQFWTAFSMMLLIGLPLILAMGYRPEAGMPQDLFFDIAGRMSGNLGGFLFALMGIGIFVSFFALVAPRAPKAGAE